MEIVGRDAARANGLRRFFTGKPCINRHTSERYVSNGMCVACQDHFNILNMDRNRAAIAAWIKANPDRKRESDRRWSKNNQARKSATDKLWREKNKLRVNKNRIEWARLDRKKNPEKHRIRVRKRRALKRNAPGEHSVADIAFIRTAQNNRCAYCRARLKSGRDVHVDHIVALVNGGSNDKRNLQITCSACNCAKSDHDPITFAQSCGLLI